MSKQHPSRAQIVAHRRTNQRYGLWVKSMRVNSSTTFCSPKSLQRDFSTSVSDNVKSAKDSGGTIELITRTVPLVGFIGGGLALLVGGFLVFASRRDEKA